MNLAKPDSLYNYGMKILCFSNEVRQQTGVGWHRVGSEIYYFQNDFIRMVGKFKKTHYTLTFTHTFEADNDQ